MAETLPAAAVDWDVEWTVVPIPTNTITLLLPGDAERWAMRIGLPVGPLAGTPLYSPNPDPDTSKWKVVPAGWDEWEWVKYGPLIQGRWYGFCAAPTKIIVVATKWKR